MSEIVPRALTIAGSDSGGGAGIQADLKTFTALRVFGMSVITAVTAQNTTSVLGIETIPPEQIKLQIDAVVNDIGIDAVKIGMLSSKEIALSVSEKVQEYNIRKIVLDPVMVTSGGEPLLDLDAKEVLVKELLPKTYIITPNIPEACELSGIEINSVEHMKKAAQIIKQLGPENVLIKGGHLDKTSEAIDIFYDGKQFYEYKTDRINTKNTHGTGCTYSAAICAGLAKGLSIMDAVREAKNYISHAIENSFDLGKGHGPLNHYWNIK